MLTSALMMMLGSSFLMLRIGGSAGSFPTPLNAEDERKNIELWLSGDMQARNTLVEHNLRLVAHIVKKYYTTGTDQDDLISIGTIGLIKGVSTYKPDKGVKLATYASRCIENEILMYFRGTKKSAGDISLSDSLDMDGEGNSLSLLDIISDDVDMLEAISHEDTCSKLRDYIATALSRREADIIKLRYGIDGKKALTQRETASLCGISRSYVSRIEKRALEKLREVIDA